ncbi:MAG: protein kinase [Polyangia bacterium]
MFCASCKGIFPIEATVCDRDGSPLERAEQVLAGRYVLKNVLGSGNMGTVYRATQLPMGREVAVKLMHSDLVRNPDLVARFEREAQAASTVDHPNAITVYDSGKSPDGQVYIAMEFLDGETLSAVIERENRLPPDRALELWIPAVKAMVVAHRRGVIHRDLKPDNIFVARRLSDDGSEEEVVKVLDFGIAKLLQGGKRASQTVVGARIGTAMYMSPEQLEGREASPRSDVYALGLVLIEMLTGRLPWGKTGTETDQAVTMLRLINPPKRLRELCAGQVFSLELQKLLDEILAFEPATRPSDAGELIRRLAQVPESAPLALRGSRRTEGSQMFEAAFLSANLKSELLADTPLTGTALPELAPHKGAGSADTPTPFLNPVPTVVTTKGVAEMLAPGTPPSGNELPSVPTVVTGSRPDMPRFSPVTQSHTPVSSSQRFDVPRSASQRFEAPTPPAGHDLPSVPTVVTPAMGARNSAPTALSPSLPLSALKPDPTTQPLPMARHPQSSDNNTIRRVGSSDGGMRAELWHSSRARVSMVASVAVLLLIGLGSLFLSCRDTKAKPKFLQPDHNATENRLDHKPPMAIKPQVVIPTEYPLTVGFSRKRHPKVQVQCGPRMCFDNCQLGPGELCVAKMIGFKPRQYSYDELKPLAQAGRVEVEVRLNR